VSPVHSRVALSRASCTDEWAVRREYRRRVSIGPQDERPVRSHGASSQASCTGASLDRRGCRHLAQNERRDEPVEPREGRRHVQNGSSGARSAEAGRSGIRLAHRRGVVRGRRVLWQNLVAHHVRRLVRAHPHGWWIAPGEERPFGHELGVHRSPRGAGRSLRDVPEGFGEKEESMRPRASLHGAQK
jgi:hypothetical protein